MKIQWTPWNVPMHRRLEVFCAAFAMFVALILGPISAIVMIYWVYAGNIFLKAISILYAAFIYYDRNAGDSGGRGAGNKWSRELWIWKHYLNYFPIDLVKTVDLPADRNYLICLFPHGVLCQSAFANFGSNFSKWPSLFPGIRSKCTTLSYHHYMPIMREMILSWGMCSASSNSLRTLLTQSNDPNHESNGDGYTSNAPVLMVGGAQEALSAFPKQYRFVLKDRKGFVKIALKTGAPLVPAISFGENDIFEQIHHAPGTTIRYIQDTIKKYTKLAPVHLVGRGFLQYNFGFIPRRHPITTVIGAPIELEKNLNPSANEVNEVHELFCKRLTELFETHKSKYVEDYVNVHVEII
ncbi:2-acylglycerol O-acyltransferase 2-like [Sitodiplosis mosellana]|uniref:2-acylglycerol O-acyltransferase 2-like n=1 Tax=Sitodiplosis mosellana TaxID=263140 RepID=UPI002444EBF0|nr:2-acylglycerol O-acyltransferase 2-like [Sitodiplosis mosellana]